MKSKIIAIAIILFAFEINLNAVQIDRAQNSASNVNNITDLNKKLIDAVESGNYKLVKALLKRGADVNAKADNGKTALMYAAGMSSGIKILKLLIKKGANVNAKSRKGKTVLMYSAYNWTIGNLKYLILKGADVDGKDNKGYTALMFAAQRGDIEVVKLLISKGANVNAVTNSGVTVLKVLLNTRYRGYVYPIYLHEIIRILKVAGAK